MAGTPPDDFYVRNADEKDARTIKSLVRQERLNPLGIVWQRFVVVEDSDGEVVACGQVKQHSDGAKELASLVVRHELRGRGIASAIVRRLQADSQEPLWLTCRSMLVPFYRRFGFRLIEDTSIMPRYFRVASRWMNRMLKVINREDGLAVMKWEG